MIQPKRAVLNDCCCENEGNMHPSNLSLAMAYVQSQKYNPHKLYDCASALAHGTLFVDLDKPFLGGHCNE